MRDEAHILPDHLKPGLKLVFCGTAAGRQSALQKAYYAHKQNKFWRTLYETGLTLHPFEPKEYPGLWKLGIGLTDIAKYAYGMDHQLPKDSLGHAAAEGAGRRTKGTDRRDPDMDPAVAITAGGQSLGYRALAGAGPQNQKISGTMIGNGDDQSRIAGA
jgi:TDG/mug DNA glycosylase family protein